MKQAFLGFFLLLYLPVFSQLRLQELFKNLQNAKEDSNKISDYRNLSNYYKTANFDSAQYFAEQGLKLSKALKYRKGELLMISQLSSVNQKHGNLDAARKYSLEALQGFREINDLKGIAASNNGLGVIEGKKGNFNIANAYFINALKIYEKIKDIRGVIQTYIKLGAVNEQNGNLDKALQYYTRARQLNSPTYSDIETEVNIINNTGIIYARNGQMQKALQLFTEGIKKSDSPELAGMHVNLLTNAGNVYQSLGNISQARACHEKSLAKARAFHLPEEEARALLNLTSVLSVKESGKAVEYLKHALEIAKKIGQKRLLTEIYGTLAEKYQEQKDYKPALFALQEQHKLLDSLYSLDKEREIADLQSVYDLDKSKQHIQTLELLNQKSTFQRNAGIAAAMLVSLLLILLGLYLRKVRKLNKELYASNQVKDKLFSIIGHDLRGPIGTVVQLVDIVDQDDLEVVELKEMLSILKKHTEASLETLDNLLQWGKTQLQGIRVNNVVFKAEDIIDKNLKIITAGAARKLIKITKSIPADLKVFADSDHFDFVVRNLLSNAVKFTYPLGIIEIKAINNHSGSGFILFSVKDNGKGIKEKDIKRLFDSFSVTDHGTAGEKGTGIGLLLCKEFIQANGGKIWVESDEGKGSTFFFTLKGETENN